MKPLELRLQLSHVEDRFPDREITQMLLAADLETRGLVDPAGARTMRTAVKPSFFGWGFGTWLSGLQSVTHLLPKTGVRHYIEWACIFVNFLEINRCELF